MNRTASHWVLVYAIIPMVWFASCDKDAPVPDLGHNYISLALGSYIEYAADSIIYDNVDFPTITADSTRFYIREVVDTIYLNNEGEETYRIERFRKKNLDDPWIIDRVWSANMFSTRFEKVEEDLRFIKLVFPPQIGKEWDGNGYIPTHDDLAYLDNWEYEYLGVDESFTINGMTFDSTCFVQQIDDENLIEKRFAVERYARNVGLVYKEMQILGKQTPTNPWTMPETGVIVRYQVIDHGQL